MVFDGLVDHFSEYQDYLTEASDTIKDIFDKIVNGFKSGNIQGKLGGFMK